MTQNTRPPALPAPHDDLVQRYHAAQAALYALTAENAASPAEAALNAVPSAQVRATVLGYAAQLASDRAGAQDSAQVQAKPPQDNPNLIANYSIYTSEKNQKNHPTPAANDSLWKIKALASVAVFGLSGLLWLQWDRAPSVDQEVAFGTSRPTLSTSASTSAPTAASTSTPPAAATATATAQSPSAAAKAFDKPILPQASDKAQSTGSADASARAPKVSANNQATSRAETAMPEAASLEPGPALSQGAPASPAATPYPTPTAPARQAAPAPEPAQAAGRAKYSAKSNATSTAQSDSAKPAMGDSETQTSAKAPAQSDALFSAIRNKDLAALQQALASGADINAKRNGTPALTLCVQTGQIEMVKLLAAQDADVNALDAQGISALAHARRLELVQISVVLEAYQAR